MLPTKDFEKIVGSENVFTELADRQTYAYDSAVLDPTTPALVVSPETTEQLGEVVALCYKHGLPMTVRGSGTNLSGGTVPDKTASVVILTQKLNRIVEINTADLYAIV